MEVKETRKYKKQAKGSKQGRPELDVVQNKRFKSERVFYYGDFKITASC